MILNTEFMWRYCTPILRSMDWNYEIQFKNGSSIKFCIVKIMNILLNNTRNRSTLAEHPDWIINQEQDLYLERSLERTHLHRDNSGDLRQANRSAVRCLPKQRNVPGCSRGRSDSSNTVVVAPRAGEGKCQGSVPDRSALRASCECIWRRIQWLVFSTCWPTWRDGLAPTIHLEVEEIVETKRNNWNKEKNYIAEKIWTYWLLSLQKWMDGKVYGSESELKMRTAVNVVK